MGCAERHLQWHVPDGHWPRAPYAKKTANLRLEAGGVPVMGLARIVDPNEGEAMLAQELADFIGVERAMILIGLGDKTSAGAATDVRPCVSCNTCWAAIAEPAPLACDTIRISARARN